MSDRTTTGQPTDNRDASGTCPSVGRQAGKQAVSQAGTTSTSSRSMALGRDHQIDEWTALARVVNVLRPDWRWADIRAALLADDRPYTAIARSAILGALADDVRHPNGLRYVGHHGVATPIPPTLAERRAELARLTEEQA